MTHARNNKRRLSESSRFGRTLRSKVVGFFLLIAFPAHAAPPTVAPKAPPAAAPPGVRVTLPHTGTYAYWIQTKLGAVAVLPVTVNAQPQITLPASAGTSGMLYVLDKDNGYVAMLPLGAAAAKSPALAVGDFKPIMPAAASLVVTPPSPATPPPTPHAVPEAGNGLARLLMDFFGLLVAAGVVWALVRLIGSRGQPLIAAARRLGVDVPDPAETPADAHDAPAYTPPAPRAVERIPDEAGAPPLPTAPPRPAPTGTSSAPQIVGVQGVAAGSSFAVPPGEVVIGRDGDNGIVLAENTVSRRHARLLHDDTGRITLTDEGSANGVYVNGERITQAVLAPGDQIQIGDSQFRLEA